MSMNKQSEPRNLLGQQLDIAKARDIAISLDALDREKQKSINNTVNAFKKIAESITPDKIEKFARAGFDVSFLLNQDWDVLATSVEERKNFLDKHYALLDSLIVYVKRGVGLSEDNV